VGVVAFPSGEVIRRRVIPTLPKRNGIETMNDAATLADDLAREVRHNPMHMYRARWFWCSILAITGWAGWALLLKLGSLRLSAEMTQFFSTVGMLPVAFGILLRRKFALETRFQGVSSSVVNGALSCGGILALLAAFKGGGNTGVVTTTTALYPMVTVLLAVPILHERLTRRQIVGLVLASLAFALFAFGGA